MGALLLAQLGLLQAAALGPLIVHSAIGQKLDADIEILALSAVEASALTVKLAPAEAFAEAGLELTSLVRSLRFSIEKKADRSIVHVSSDLPINDPFITLLFELNANGNRTMRQYALLLDPPELNDNAVAQSQTQTQPQIAANTEPETAAPNIPLAAPGPSNVSHLIKRGETLGRIAAQVRPEGVNLEQVLLALQRANPDAFAGNNINRIKTGSVLTVPAADEIRAIDAAGARQLVMAQTADFNRYRNTLAQQARSAVRPETSTAADADGNRSSSGKVGVQVTEPAASRTSADKLQLSAAGTAAGNLDKIAAEKALAEANQRIESLEKNISDMQQLLELKNKSLATLQNPAPPATAPASAAPAAVAEQTPSAQPAPAVKPAVKPALKPAASQAAPATSPTDWLQNPLLLPAGGFLLALLLVAGLLRLRRRARLRQSEGKDAFAEPALDAQSVFGTAGGRNIDTSNSVFHSNFVPSVSQIDTNEVDAVAEADVYIAYGRDEQAEEILLDALRTHPERNALRVKLLEIYATRKDKQKFGKLAADLQAITGGVGEEWKAVDRLSQSLDPASMPPGSSAKPAAARARTDSASTRVEPNAPVSDVLDFDHKLEGLLASRKNSTTADSQAAPAAKTTGLSLSGIEFETASAQSLASDAPTGTALHSKLDLAVACQEIGDLDGARELLAEVAGSTQPELAQKAKSLLRQLA
jgi:pilus assembly protein FimV